MESITTQQFEQALEENNANCSFIDVRTPAEYRTVHIDGVENMPVDNLEDYIEALRKKEKVYVHCKSGSRTDAACKKLENSNLRNIYKITGGIDQWIKDGLPVVRGKSTLSLMRQVQIAAGSLILMGVILGFAIHEGWYFLSGFVGAGLLFAGLTGTCGMAILLSKMPWNK